MKEMTDEEADALSEYYAKNPPTVDPAKNGGFAKKQFRMVAVDRLSEDYLLTKSIATHKTPTEIIGELVREEIARSSPVPVLGKH
ncbi:MAG: hypothetical protein FWG66_07075 [Spirochaetes bacterium]|nr:hypothetical protein [Spirochaetota bacterium]